MLLLLVELFVHFCSWDQAWFLVFIGNVSILKTLGFIGNHFIVLKDLCINLWRCIWGQGHKRGQSLILAPICCKWIHRLLISWERGSEHERTSRELHGIWTFIPRYVRLRIHRFIISLIDMLSKPNGSKIERILSISKVLWSFTINDDKKLDPFPWFPH